MSEAPQSAPPTPRWTWARIARRIRVPLGFLSAAFFIWLARPTRTSLIAGSLVMLPGLILRGFASGHVQKDKQLTTSGPYAYTRNPLYLGSLLLASKGRQSLLFRLLDNQEGAATVHRCGRLVVARSGVAALVPPQ